MKIAIIGKNGQLGKSIKKLVDSKKYNINNDTPIYTFIGRDELDLSITSNIESFFKNSRFDIIVNAAAYTAVDKAEEEKDLANQINNLAVEKLAEIAFKNETSFIHISTDYVFDGKNKNPYSEIDPTNPINVYGKTKLDGEQAIYKIMKNNATIIRTSWVYSEYGNNFVETMMRLGKDLNEIKVISDQIGSPTYATDLAKIVIKFIEIRYQMKTESNTQTYHYSNNGEISWYDFALTIFQLSRIDCKVKPIDTTSFLSKAERPENSVMSKIKIEKELGINIPFWKNSLKEAINIIIGEVSKK